MKNIMLKYHFMFYNGSAKVRNLSNVMIKTRLEKTYFYTIVFVTKR